MQYNGTHCSHDTHCSHSNFFKDNIVVEKGDFNNRSTTLSDDTRVSSETFFKRHSSAYSQRFTKS